MEANAFYFVVAGWDREAVATQSSSKPNNNPPFCVEEYRNEERGLRDGAFALGRSEVNSSCILMHV